MLRKIKPRYRWRVTGLLPLLAVLASGCGTIPKLGLVETPVIDERRGIVGSEESPVVLNPMIPHKLVMAGGECRWFSVRVPRRWYWKVTLTAVCPGGKTSRLEASFDTSDGGWKPMIPFETSRVFDLVGRKEKDHLLQDRQIRDSKQGSLAAANVGTERPLVLKIRQSGAPVRILLESQVSAFGDVLLAPPLPKNMKP